MQLDSSIHSADIIPTSALNDPLLPDFASPDGISDCCICNLSLRLRCETIQLCQCDVFLQYMRSFVSGVYYYFTESRGGPEGSGGNSMQVASIYKCVGVLLVRLIL